MNDEELCSLIKEKSGAKNSIEPSLQKQGPDFSKTGKLIRHIHTIMEQHADGSYVLISSNSWIDRNGLPKKEKPKIKEIESTKLKAPESY